MNAEQIIAMLHKVWKTKTWKCDVCHHEWEEHESTKKAKCDWCEETGHCL